MDDRKCLARACERPANGGRFCARHRDHAHAPECLRALLLDGLTPDQAAIIFRVELGSPNERWLDGLVNLAHRLAQ